MDARRELITLNMRSGRLPRHRAEGKGRHGQAHVGSSELEATSRVPLLHAACRPAHLRFMAVT
jgi:hypothetical protein